MNRIGCFVSLVALSTWNAGAFQWDSHPAHFYSKRSESHPACGEAALSLRYASSVWKASDKPDRAGVLQRWNLFFREFRKFITFTHRSADSDLPITSQVNAGLPYWIQLSNRIFILEDSLLKSFADIYYEVHGPSYKVDVIAPVIAAQMALLVGTDVVNVLQPVLPLWLAEDTLLLSESQAFHSSSVSLQLRLLRHEIVKRLKMETDQDILMMLSAMHGSLLNLSEGKPLPAGFEGLHPEHRYLRDLLNGIPAESDPLQFWALVPLIPHIKDSFNELPMEETLEILFVAGFIIGVRLFRDRQTFTFRWRMSHSIRVLTGHYKSALVNIRPDLKLLQRLQADFPNGLKHINSAA
jgi:hypothetical protein